LYLSIKAAERKAAEDLRRKQEQLEAQVNQNICKRIIVYPFLNEKLNLREKKKLKNQ